MKIQAFTLFILLSLGAFAQTSTEKIKIVQNYLDAAFSKDTDTQMSLMSVEIIDYHPTVLAPPAMSSSRSSFRLGGAATILTPLLRGKLGEALRMALVGVDGVKG